ncbi:kinase-like protein [Moniliophthora roreri]|uniref:Protein kinase domain-containing protein n=1 Tax=Moniliophthora roreri TaxID=221103 RepID=A0A0W0G617_MONRR|nr:kinase-like protein [Moniliophthora roreri]
MYTESSQSNQHSLSLFGQLFSSRSTTESNISLSRPYRPRVITEEREDERNTSALDHLDPDQRLSAQLVAESQAQSRVESGENNYNSSAIQPRSAPLLQDDVQPATLSPAAMFLSAFNAPPVSAKALPDDEGEVVAGYTLGGIIGYGGFSIIRRAYSSSGDVAAVKIVRRSDLLKQNDADQARKRLDHETQVWSTLSHEHILPLFTSVHTSYADFFITLLCPCGSLFDILKRDGRPALPQDDVGTMFRQVVRGLRYLHEVVEYVHRDMKLENVLVDEYGTCKIGDFGMSRKIGEVLEDDVEVVDESEFPQPGIHRAASVSHPSTSKRPGLGGMPLHHTVRHGNRHRTTTTTGQNPVPTSIVQPGSLPYAAPELLLPPSAPGPRVPDPAQDMWALGVMLYALLTGRLPFADSFEPRLTMKILHAVYDIPPGIGSGAERILQGCLDRCVSSRWTIAMVDEVAPGVGWGTESDRMHIATDEELRTQTKTPQSRSRSRVAEIHVPETPAWDHEDNRSAASADAASRRSVSRAQRSRSRAPILTDEGSSSRSMERSMSRPRRRLSRPPSSPTFSTSPVPALERTSRSSSSASSDFQSRERAHPMELERGRRPKKAAVPISTFLSRSPSPGVSPKTPVDLIARFSPSSPSEEDVDDLEEEGSTTRGRTFAKSRAVPIPISSKSGVHTPRNSGDDKQHDDPRHRIYTISASPPIEDEGLDDMYGPESPNWGESSLTLEGSVLGSPSSAASSLPPRTTFRHIPGPITQSLSDGVEKARFNVVAEDDGRRARPRQRQQMLRFEDELPLKQRSGSTPPGLLPRWSSEGSSSARRPEMTTFSRGRTVPTTTVMLGAPASTRSKSLGRFDIQDFKCGRVVVNETSV